MELAFSSDPNRSMRVGLHHLRTRDKALANKRPGNTRVWDKQVQEKITITGIFTILQQLDMYQTSI